MLQNCNLPSNVVAMILVRLPAKPVLRCKAVCKSWYEFLNSQKFIRMYRGQPKTKRLLLKSYVPDDQFLSICADTCKRDVSVLPFDFDYKMSLQDSCNGLVCLSINFGPSKLILWNPATRKQRAICLPFRIPFKCIAYAGLGFVPETDDYKIIWIPTKNSTEMNMWVYSLRSESWKMAESLSFAYYIWPPTSINGCIHWITCNQTSEDRILAIDLCSDRAQYLELPFGFHTSIDNSIGLAVINGSLSAVISLEFDALMNRNFEVWVMEEYGVKDSWTKYLVVGPFKYMSRPVGSWKDSKILFLDRLDENVLFSYDLYNKAIDFVYHGVTFPLNYIESFESVDGRRILAPEDAAG